MTEDEINAFLDNPGKEGLYMFKRPSRLHHGRLLERLRKFHNGKWYSGYSAEDFKGGMPSAIAAALENESEDRIISFNWLRQSATVAYYCDMHGNFPGRIPDPVQLDLFQ